MELIQQNEVSQAGWNISGWCAATSISRATFYTLTLKPRTVKIGRRTVVIESPQAYLARIAGLKESQREAA